MAEVGVELIKVVDGWDGEEDMEIMDSSTWAGSDRDYTYDEVGVVLGNNYKLLILVFVNNTSLLI